MCHYLCTCNSPTPNRRSGQPMNFGFDTIRSMGAYIQLFTTISPNYFQSTGKVGQLRSYSQNYINTYLGSLKQKSLLSQKNYLGLIRYNFSHLHFVFHFWLLVPLHLKMFKSSWSIMLMGGRFVSLQLFEFDRLVLRLVKFAQLVGRLFV